MTILRNRQILLGISGGIAAYKVAELVRLLVKAEAKVRVVMTPAAQCFITPLTLQALSGNSVHTDLLDPAAEAGMGHIELARWAHLIVIAPCSADCIARLATGQANDLLTTVCLASTAPLALAPAMNQAMWLHPATQANTRLLSQRQVQLWGPAQGQQACGDLGPGRMLEAEQLFERVKHQFAEPMFAGKKVVITAGPTREALDPVRYLSNHSSGKMGYALAAAAAATGAQTVLISGPCDLPVPVNVELHKVTSAEEMLACSLRWGADADVFIAAAAVADYRPTRVEEQKIKKGDQQTLQLSLVKNPDIIAHVAALQPHPFTVGFAAETEKIVDYATAKLRSKNLDMIIANDVSNSRIGFNSDNNAVLVIDCKGHKHFDERSKHQLALDLMHHIATRL